MQQYLQDKLKEIEQNQLIGYWIKRKGITFADLSRHPRIDDVILLLQINTLSHLFNHSERGYWGAVWERVYIHRKPLDKYLHKIQKNTQQAITRHNYKQQKHQAKLQKIKQLRENQDTQILVHDNDDKGTGLKV